MELASWLQPSMWRKAAEHRNERGHDEEEGTGVPGREQSHAEHDSVP